MNIEYDGQNAISMLCICVILTCGQMMPNEFLIPLQYLGLGRPMCKGLNIAE